MRLVSLYFERQNLGCFYGSYSFELMLSRLFYHLFCREPSLAGSELTARLEPAFLAGLRSVQPDIRIKFMEVCRFQYSLCQTVLTYSLFCCS